MEQVYVTLVNRTSSDLNGLYDGKQHKLPAGSRTQWPESIAQKFKEQNPVMGSENYYTGDKQSLLAIVEQGDDDGPIEQSTAKERWDRSQIPTPAGMVTETVKGHGFNPMKDRQAGLPPQVTGFENDSLPASAPPAEVVQFDKP